MANIIFIGGTGRCGTSVLREVLSKHPDVATLPFEYRFIVDPDGIAEFYATFSECWSPYVADRKIKRLLGFLRSLIRRSPMHRAAKLALNSTGLANWLVAPRSYVDWELEKHIPGFGDFIDELAGELIEFTYAGCWAGMESYMRSPHLHFTPPKSKDELRAPLRNFVNKTVNALADQKGARFYVEDNTWNILFAQELLDIFPDGKIIHIFRDPRDVVSSLMSQRWTPSDVSQVTRFFNSIIKRWFDIRESIPAKRLLEVRFEALISRPEDTMKKICAYTDLPYDPALLTADLSKPNIGRWKTGFNAREKEILERETGWIVEKLGYA